MQEQDAVIDTATRINDQRVKGGRDAQIANVNITGAGALRRRTVVAGSGQGKSGRTIGDGVSDIDRAGNDGAIGTIGIHSKCGRRQGHISGDRDSHNFLITSNSIHLNHRGGIGEGQGAISAGVGIGHIDVNRIQVLAAAYGDIAHIDNVTGTVDISAICVIMRGIDNEIPVCGIRDDIGTTEINITGVNIVRRGTGVDRHIIGHDHIPATRDIQGRGGCSAVVGKLDVLMQGHRTRCACIGGVAGIDIQGIDVARSPGVVKGTQLDTAAGNRGTGQQIEIDIGAVGVDRGIRQVDLAARRRLRCINGHIGAYFDSTAQLHAEARRAAVSIFGADVVVQADLARPLGRRREARQILAAAGAVDRAEDDVAARAGTRGIQNKRLVDGIGGNIAGCTKIDVAAVVGRALLGVDGYRSGGNNHIAVAGEGHITRNTHAVVVGGNIAVQRDAASGCPCAAGVNIQLIDELACARIVSKHAKIDQTAIKDTTHAGIQGEVVGQGGGINRSAGEINLAGRFAIADFGGDGAAAVDFHVTREGDAIGCCIPAVGGDVVIQVDLAGAIGDGGEGIQVLTTIDGDRAKADRAAIDQTTGIQGQGLIERIARNDARTQIDSAANRVATLFGVNGDARRRYHDIAATADRNAACVGSIVIGADIAVQGQRPGCNCVGQVEHDSVHVFVDHPSTIGVSNHPESDTTCDSANAVGRGDAQIPGATGVGGDRCGAAVKSSTIGVDRRVLGQHYGRAEKDRAVGCRAAVDGGIDVTKQGDNALIGGHAQAAQSLGIADPTEAHIAVGRGSGINHQSFIAGCRAVNGGTERIRRIGEVDRAGSACGIDIGVDADRFSRRDHKGLDLGKIYMAAVGVDGYRGVVVIAAVIIKGQGAVGGIARRINHQAGQTHRCPNIAQVNRACCRGSGIAAGFQGQGLRAVNVSLAQVNLAGGLGHIAGVGIHAQIRAQRNGADHFDAGAGRAVDQHVVAQVDDTIGSGIGVNDNRAQIVVVHQTQGYRTAGFAGIGVAGIDSQGVARRVGVNIGSAKVDRAAGHAVGVAVLGIDGQGRRNNHITAARNREARSPGHAVVVEADAAVQSHRTVGGSAVGVDDHVIQEGRSPGHRRQADIAARRARAGIYGQIGAGYGTGDRGQAVEVNIAAGCRVDIGIDGAQRPSGDNHDARASAGNMTTISEDIAAKVN